MSVRVKRVAGEILKVLSEVIGREHGDVTDGLVTITDVDVSPDIRNAKVFVSILGGTIAKTKVVSLLNDRTIPIRSAIARKLYLRHVPALVFMLDETGERADRINKLINEWHEQQPTPGPKEEQ